MSQAANQLLETLLSRKDIGENSEIEKSPEPSYRTSDICIFNGRSWIGSACNQ